MTIDNFDSRFFKTSQGLKLHYRFSHQPKSNQVCILLHGFMNDSAIFIPLMQKLKTQFNLIAIDFRGHGESDWDNNSQYSHQDLVQDLNEFIAQFDYEQWHFIGHSLGARVALLYNLYYQYQPASMVLVDTGPITNRAGSEKVRQDAEKIPQFFKSHEDYFCFLRLQYFLADEKRLRNWSLYGLKKINNNYQLRTDPKFVQALWSKNENNQSTLISAQEDKIWQALHHLVCPTLVIRGQASAILSQNVAEKMRSTLKQGQLIIIEKAGHAVPLDNPTAFENSIEKFYM